jgi:AraC-like DNA-binding protein
MRPAAARESRTGRRDGSGPLIQSPRDGVAVQPLVSARVVWPFIAVYRDLGCPDELGLELLGYDRTSITDPDARLPWSDVQRGLRFALERTRRSDLGLLAAEHFAPGLFDLLEFAVRSQTTLGGAMSSLRRLLPLIIESAELQVVASAETAVLRFEPPPGEPCEPSAVEFAMACLQIGLRRCTGRNELTPREVRFRHARPAHTKTHDAVFRARLTFGAAVNGLVIPLEMLDLPLVQADSALSATLQRIGEAFVAAQPRAFTWRQAVRHRIADQLCDGCSCETIARSLAVTPRTLLRRLKDEATTFRDELEAVRHEKAMTYLRDTTLSVSELAYLLGFSSVATFHRAFKRWTRTTPGDYRRRVLEPQPSNRAADRKTA